MYKGHVLCIGYYNSAPHHNYCSSHHYTTGTHNNCGNFGFQYYGF